VLLELTYLRLAWTFNVDFAHYLLAGVIWMLGWNMVLMAVLVRLPVVANAVLGVVIMAGHNLAAVAVGDPRQLPTWPSLGWLWQILYYGGGITVGGADSPNFLVLYSIVPWTGVMAAGYAFGAVLGSAPVTRRRACYALGGVAVAAFLAAQWYYAFHAPRPASANAQPVWMSFLTASKYPPSLLFLLMTLGPTVAALPLLEEARGRVAGWLTVFGRVPLFYYLLHIPLIHAAAVGISLFRSPAATGWLFGNHPMSPGKPPEGYAWSLGLLYLVTGLVVVGLYYPCWWFARLKSRRKDTWLSYL
jgi:uncharacterized membrane protein